METKYVFERKRSGIIKNNWKSYDKSHWQSETDEFKEHKRIDANVGCSVPIKRIVRVADVRWPGHVLQRIEGNILKEASNFK